MSKPKLVRIQEKGQVTLPVEFRRRLGLKKGDLVAIEETPEGVLITPQEMIAVQALDRIGKALRQQGLPLEEVIETGRQERAQIIRDEYGLPADEEER